MDEHFYIIEGHQLCAARQQLGLSIDDLARKSGQAADVLVAWETGHRAPDDETQFRVMDALDPLFRRVPLRPGQGEHLSAVEFIGENTLGDGDETS